MKSTPIIFWCPLSIAVATVLDLAGEKAPLKTPEQVVTEWAAAFNRQDAAGAAALYHEDATNIQVAEGEPARGRQAILDSFTSFFRAFPDSYTRVENMFEDGEWSIIEWVGGGTFRGEFAGGAPTSRSLYCEGAASSKS